MRPLIEKIKKECWDGLEENPNKELFSNTYTSVDGIMTQIESIKKAGIVFILDKEGKLRKYIAVTE